MERSRENEVEAGFIQGLIGIAMPPGIRKGRSLIGTLNPIAIYNTYIVII